MTIAMLGIDLGKNSCSVAGLDVLRRHEPNLVALLAQHAPEMVSPAARLHRHHAGR